MAAAVVCVDFDDTLVESQTQFEASIDALATHLADRLSVTRETAMAAFHRHDAGWSHLGRHRNRFLLAMCATYCDLAGVEHVPLGDIGALADVAARPYDAAPQVKPGVRPALEALRRRCPGAVWLVTAADPATQVSRIHRSGLADYFDRLHVVPEKTPEVFAEIAATTPMQPDGRRIMIGNSPVSDIAPSLAAGFEAIHVRAPTWQVDDGELPQGVPAFDSFAAAVAALLAPLHV